MITYTQPVGYGQYIFIHNFKSLYNQPVGYNS